MKKPKLTAITNETVTAAFLAALTVYLFSLVEKIYDPYGAVFFNKGLCSALFLLIAFYFIRSSLLFFRSKSMDGQERLKIGLCMLFSFILFFSELSGLLLRLYEDQRPVKLEASSIGLMALLSVLLSVASLPFFYALFSAEAGTSGAFAKKGKGKRRYFLLLFLLCLMAYLPCFLAFWPGVTYNDINWQWRMYIEKDFSTHHPLIHTLLAGSIFELFRSLTGSYDMGLAAYSLLQLILIALAAAATGTFLKKWGANRGARIGAQLFYMLYPFIPVNGVTATKDVIFGVLFLLVMVCLCDMALESKLYKGPRLLGSMLLLILMQLFRNNAVYGVLFTAVIFLICGVFGLKRRGREDSGQGEDGGSGILKAGKEEGGSSYVLKLSVLLFASGALALVCFLGLKTAVSAKDGSRAEMLSVPCQQLARVYRDHGDELSEDEMQRLCFYIKEKGLKNYKYYVSDPVKANLDMDALYADTRGFISLWTELGLRYPGTYIASLFANTMGLWYLGGDSSCYVEYDIVPMEEDYGFRSASRLPRLKELYSWFTDEHIKSYLPVLSLVFYTPFFAWGMTLSGVKAVFKRRYELLIPIAFALAYMLSLVPGPCIIVRYMFGIILSLPLILCLSFSKLKKKAKTE